MADYQKLVKKRPIPIPGRPLPPPTPELDAEAAAARAEIARCRDWLTRQDVVLEQEGSINWNASQKKSKVTYDRDLLAQGMTRVRFAGGRMSLDDGCTQPLDTSGMVTAFSGPGRAIFVMSHEGNLHVTSHKVGLRLHSSLLADQNVAGAGELQVGDGSLLWLTNTSGHYTPGLEHLLQVLHFLSKRGCPSTFKDCCFTSDSTIAAALTLPEVQRVSDAVSIYGKLYQTFDEFTTALHDCEVAGYELRKLMAYQSHFDPHFMAAHGWRWRLSARADKEGFYRIDNDLPIAHSTVRKWLKDQRKVASSSVQSGVER